MNLGTGAILLGAVREFLEEGVSTCHLVCAAMLSLSHDYTGVIGYGVFIFVLMMMAATSEYFPNISLTVIDPAFFLLLVKFKQITGSINWHYARFTEQIMYTEPLLDLMAAKPTMRRKGTKQFLGVQDGFEFRNVKFEYPSRPGEPVLNGLSFKLKVSVYLPQTF